MLNTGLAEAGPAPRAWRWAQPAACLVLPLLGWLPTALRRSGRPPNTGTSPALARWRHPVPPSSCLAGAAPQVKYTQPFPVITPPGSYTVTLDGRDGDDRLFCVAVDFQASQHPHAPHARALGRSPRVQAARAPSRAPGRLQQTCVRRQGGRTAGLACLAAWRSVDGCSPGTLGTSSVALARPLARPGCLPVGGSSAVTPRKAPQPAAPAAFGPN